jgi:hypothetical protein
MPAKWLTEIVERDLKKGTRYWSIEGRLWSEENPDAYAGLHNHDGVMLVFDEASGIPDSIWSVADGFFTENTPHRFHLAFSNPRRNTGYFYETFHSKRAFWNTRNIDARDVEGIRTRTSTSASSTSTDRTATRPTWKSTAPSRAKATTSSSRPISSTTP